MNHHLEYGHVVFSEPMRTPKTLKIAEIQARRIAVDWESLGYNITRCHTFNVTICYHYFRGHNESKADCLDMDSKAPQHVVNHLPPYTNVSLKMILTNPEGRKESEETIIQTDEDGKFKLLTVHCCLGGRKMMVKGIVHYAASFLLIIIILLGCLH